jgi:hypothetical protein
LDARASAHSRLSGREVLVLGGAQCLADDLARLGPWAGPVVAVNESGIAAPRVDLWASLHPDKLHGWMKQRPAKDYLSVSLHKKFGDYCDFYIEPRWNGSSGLYAADVALALGAAHVTLAGVPMDGSTNAHRGSAWAAFNGYRKGWLEALPQIKGRVSSVSGWTRELLCG